MSELNKVLKSFTGYETNKIFEVPMINGSADFNGLWELDNFVTSYFRNKSSVWHGFRLEVPGLRHLVQADEGWFDYKDDKKRTVVKRYSDFLWDNLSIKFPNEFWGEFGSRASEVYRVNASDKYVFDFVDLDGDWDWSPGKFGESDHSCMWGDYDNGRIHLFTDDIGGALRFYLNDGSRGCARAWVVASEDSLFFFNLYDKSGGGDRRLKTRLSAIFTGYEVSIQQAGFNWNGGYVNSDYAIEVCAPGCELQGYYNLSVGGIACYECGDLIEGEIYWGNEEPFCECCYDDAFYSCDQCGETIHRDYGITMANGRTVCDWCYRRSCFECSHCSDVYFNDDRYEGADGELYCEDCWGELFSNCDQCGELYFCDDLVDGLCEDCVAEAVSES